MPGRAHRFGDHVNTDEIIPARYLSTTDRAELARHCMEDADPAFAKAVQPGDVIVAGINFGCGSSREHAPVAIQAAGCACVIARSFARIFYRNCVNIGLPIFECPDAVEAIDADDRIDVDLAAGQIRNLTREQTYRSLPFPDEMRAIFDAGGLMAYVKTKHRA